MTRKDYRALAEAINNVRETLIVAHASEHNRVIALAAVDSVTARIASVLQYDNSAFDRNKFFAAANYGDK